MNNIGRKDGLCLVLAFRGPNCLCQRHVDCYVVVFLINVPNGRWLSHFPGRKLDTERPMSIEGHNKLFRSRKIVVLLLEWWIFMTPDLGNRLHWRICCYDKCTGVIYSTSSSVKVRLSLLYSNWSSIKKLIAIRGIYSSNNKKWWKTKVMTLYPKFGRSGIISCVVWRRLKWYWMTKWPITRTAIKSQTPVIQEFYIC